MHCISIVEKLFERNYVIKAVNQAQGSNLLYFFIAILNGLRVQFSVHVCTDRCIKNVRGLREGLIV